MCCCCPLAPAAACQALSDYACRALHPSLFVTASQCYHAVLHPSQLVTASQVLPHRAAPGAVQAQVLAADGRPPVLMLTGTLSPFTCRACAKAKAAQVCDPQSDKGLSLLRRSWRLSCAFSWYVAATFLEGVARAAAVLLWTSLRWTLACAASSVPAASTPATAAWRG